MGGLSPLLVSLLTTDVKSVASRAKKLTVYYLIAGFFALAGVASLATAAGLFLARRMSPDVAALVLAGVFLSFSLITFAVVSAWSSRQRKIISRRSIAPTLAITAAVTLLPAILSNRLTFGILSAAAAGYVIANRKPRDIPRRTHSASEK